MKKLLAVALPAGLAILAAAVLLSSFRSRSDAFDARLERARVKREFDERAALARALPVTGPEWREEAAGLLRGYFDELQAIRNRWPGVPGAPSALQAAEEERKGKLSDKDRAAIQDFQKYADARLATLRSGGYAPVASAAAPGLRLDLVAVEPAASPEGGPGLRIDFALWGAPRLVERDRSTPERTVTKTVVPVAFRTLAFRLLDPSGKLYGEMNGNGEPYQKLVDPERFAEDFPPGVLFGTWWVELLPREASTVEIEVAADVRGAGGTVRPAAFKVALPVADAWKLPPGAVFQAELREAAPSR